MATNSSFLAQHLLHRVIEVRRRLGAEGLIPLDVDQRLADLLDSMALVEFLALVADDCGTSPETIERSVGRVFGTVVELAQAMAAVGLVPGAGTCVEGTTAPSIPAPVTGIGDAPRAAASLPSSDGPAPLGWLAGTAVRLGDTIQATSELDTLLGREAGWFARHAGIRERRLWVHQEPLHAAVEACGEILEQATLPPRRIGALLVASEAPPLLMGLAATLHERLGLSPRVPAVEVGAACTGFLASLCLGQALLPQVGNVLLVGLEAPSRYLTLAPGPAGEAAALFGEGTSATLLTHECMGTQAVPLWVVEVGVAGSGEELIQVEKRASGSLEIQLDGIALAGRAVRIMAQAVRELLQRLNLPQERIAGLVAHGGNGRLPRLLARQLDLHPERVWSTTAATGNLGSVSLPAAWAAHSPAPEKPVVWTAVGAGLTWGTALTGHGAADHVSR